MLKHKSFFEGHRGEVLSLAGTLENNYFYSSGSEGLIVRWQLDKPNEGQVLVRLQGYISFVRYDKDSAQIVAAINHKGVFFINALSGKVERLIEIPAVSFTSMELVSTYVILSTTIGEIIILDRQTGNIIFRKDTGLVGASTISIDFKHIWFSTAKGVQAIDLCSLELQNKLIESPEPIKSMGMMGTKIVLLTDKDLQVWDANKFNLLVQYKDSTLSEGNFLWLNPKTQSMLVQLRSNKIGIYSLGKKEVQFKGFIQNEHIGQINDLLWIENHKFAVSAGADKKIGVWQ